MYQVWFPHRMTPGPGRLQRLIGECPLQGGYPRCHEGSRVQVFMFRHVGPFLTLAKVASADDTPLPMACQADID